MATTQTALGVDSLKGPNAGGDLHIYRVTYKISGTYATGARPALDLAAAVKAKHMGLATVTVKWAKCLGDYNDGTNVYTSSNTDSSLSGSTLTIQLHSGATDGDAGSEISNATAVDGTIGFIFACTLA